MVTTSEQMLTDIERDTRLTADTTGRSALARAVMDAMARVPREAFVPAELADQAYVNRPLPIGHGQTISQPFIVALMTDLLEPRPHQRVLEVGTGCGYQSAVLAELVTSVYSIETVVPLAHAASERLDELGHDNVHIGVGDGRGGWPSAAPFDRIIVTAGADAIAQAWIDQLAPGGHLVVPVGGGWRGQELVRVTRDRAGETRRERILPVAFVPLTG
jgi:protein-L-isoaspartate(D-aspartate) O-methyltransferase